MRTRPRTLPNDGATETLGPKPFQTGLTVGGSVNATIIVIVVLLVLLLLGGAASFLGFRHRRSTRLQQNFGPEYKRTVEEAGGRGKAESQLRDREKRHKRLELRPLSDEIRARYRSEWNDIQQRFVDEPGRAVEDADRLTTRIMHDRGYPVDDFEQRAADVSVDHPRVVQHYRAAHDVAVEHEKGQADTERLRGAVTSYRALVDALLEDAAKGPAHEDGTGPRPEQVTREDMGPG